MSPSLLKPARMNMKARRTRPASAAADWVLVIAIAPSNRAREIAPTATDLHRNGWQDNPAPERLFVAKTATAECEAWVASLVDEAGGSALLDLAVLLDQRHRDDVLVGGGRKH